MAGGIGRVPVAVGLVVVVVVASIRSSIPPKLAVGSGAPLSTSSSPSGVGRALGVDVVVGVVNVIGSSVRDVFGRHVLPSLQQPLPVRQ